MRQWLWLRVVTIVLAISVAIWLPSLRFGMAVIILAAMMSIVMDRLAD